MGWKHSLSRDPEHIKWKMCCEVGICCFLTFIYWCSASGCLLKLLLLGLPTVMDYKINPWAKAKPSFPHCLVFGYFLQHQNRKRDNYKYLLVWLLHDLHFKKYSQNLHLNSLMEAHQVNDCTITEEHPACALGTLPTLCTSQGTAENITGAGQAMPSSPAL